MAAGALALAAGCGGASGTGASPDGGAGSANGADAGRPTGDTRWAKRFGRTNDGAPMSAATDAAGAALVMGRYYGPVDFGGGPIDTPAENYQLFVAKYDAAGAHAWSRGFGDFTAEIAGGVAADAHGDVLVAGGCSGTIDFGGGPLSSAGANDVVVAKLDAKGRHVWSKRFGDANDQSALAVAVDGEGSVVLVAEGIGAVDFGGGASGDASTRGLWVAKLDAGGRHLWSKRFSAGTYQLSGAATFDPAGDVVLTGSFGGSVDFGGAPLTTRNDADVFVVKLDGATGAHRWSEQFGGEGYLDAGTGVATNAAGDIFVTGTISGLSVDLGGGPLTGGADDPDVLVLALDAGGRHRWSRRYGDTSQDGGRGVALTPSGDVLVTGYFGGLLRFGDRDEIASAGGSNAFVAKLDAKGGELWIHGYGGSSAELGTSVAATPSGDALAGGSCQGTIDFGTGALAGNGYFDQFLVRLEP
jgi:hypothetical protein